MISRRLIFWNECLHELTLCADAFVHWCLGCRVTLQRHERTTCINLHDTNIFFLLIHEIAKFVLANLSTNAATVRQRNGTLIESSRQDLLSLRIRQRLYALQQLLRRESIVE